MSPTTAIVCWLLASGVEVCTAPVPTHEAYDLRMAAPDGAQHGTIYRPGSYKYRDVTTKPRSGPEIEIDDTPAWRNLR